MNRNSIRWRLPASYAVIALLAALSLGSVMLLVLRDYYANQELEYLYGNAEALRPIFEKLLESPDLPKEELQNRIAGLTFLSQVQIRVLDANGNTIADSGKPDSNQVVAVSGLSVEKSSLSGAAVEPLPFGSETRVFIFSSKHDAPPQPVPFEVQAPPEKWVDVVLPVSASPYGYGFAAQPGIDPSRRSSQTASVLLVDSNGKKLGVLEFSNGPSYGADVINSVTVAWLIASVFAMAVAALTGWYMSRRVTRPVLALEQATQQMERGNLAIRVALPNEKQLEFLSLAHSFNGMAEQVEQTVSTLRAFVADAAHELNTPLTALQTNVELAASAADEVERGELLARAQAQIERLQSLVTGLLNLSRLEGKKDTPHREAVDLGALAQTLGELYASRAEQAGLTFDLELPGGPMMTLGDLAQLRRALENLLDNAIKFTPAGGEVRLRLARAGGQITLSVEDTGIGIPPEDQPLLFRRFHRGRNVAHYPGNGLGLAIVQAIAEAHGGAVSLAAFASARGACFVLALPSHSTS